MTTDERVQAVADHGFTDRQARFLILVMRHSGLCIKRQYAEFAGVANGGEKCNAFFEKLVRRGFATATACIHSRAHLYHVFSKPLYYAIGDVDSRYRRSVPARRAAERLMRLDAALACPEFAWLTTRAEKLAHLHSVAPPTPSAPPANTPEAPASNRADAFPGTFPIGLDPSGRVVLLYLALVPWTDDFRRFVIGHTALLATVPTWTLRIVFPQPLQRAIPEYETVVTDELRTRLDKQTTQLLYRYFLHRQLDDFNTVPEPLRTDLRGYAERFTGPWFSYRYKWWRTERAAALVPIPATIPEALASGSGVVEPVVLPHTYEHLMPLVALRRARRRAAQPRTRRGTRLLHTVNPVLNSAR